MTLLDNLRIKTSPCRARARLRLALGFSRFALVLGAVAPPQYHFHRPAPDQPFVLNPSDYLPTSTSRHRYHFAIAFQAVRNPVPQTINLQPSPLLYHRLMYTISFDVLRINSPSYPKTLL